MNEKLSARFDFAPLFRREMFGRCNGPIVLGDRIVNKDVTRAKLVSQLHAPAKSMTILIPRDVPWIPEMSNGHVYLMYQECTTQHKNQNFGPFQRAINFDAFRRTLIKWTFIILRRRRR